MLTPSKCYKTKNAYDTWCDNLGNNDNEATHYCFVSYKLELFLGVVNLD